MPAPRGVGGRGWLTCRRLALSIFKLFSHLNFPFTSPGKRTETHGMEKKGNVNLVGGGSRTRRLAFCIFFASACLGQDAGPTLMRPAHIWLEYIVSVARLQGANSLGRVPSPQSPVPTLCRRAFLKRVKPSKMELTRSLPDARNKSKRVPLPHPLLLDISFFFVCFRVFRLHGLHGLHGLHDPTPTTSSYHNDDVYISINGQQHNCSGQIT